MNRFRAYRIHNDNGRVFGQLETMSLDDLSPGEVVIRAKYSSVNYKDALGATGAGKIVRRFPLVGGIDVSGYVESSNDARLKEGDEVLVTGYEMGVNHDGGYAERVRVPAAWVTPLPRGMSLFQAMALGTAGFTVGLCAQRLEDNRQTPDMGPIVVTGATGGVGSIAIDILSARGYQVTAVTGKAHEHGYLRSLGAEEILDRGKLDLGSRPLESALWGGAIDNVGGDILAWLTRTTKPWGNIVSVGLVGGSELHTTVMPFILRGISLIGVTASGCPMELRNRIWERLATDLAPRHLDAIASRRVGLKDLPNAFDALLKGAAKGRTVVTLDKG
ncbi:MAG: oxidoreductase [Gammaproteobacteria bacterium]|nr:oxidoreductase [Gammaproteobacteria bacterium]